MKKVLSVFLAVVMLLSVFSAAFTVFADYETDGIYYDDSNNARYYKGGVIQKGWISEIGEETYWDENGEPYPVEVTIWYYGDPTTGILAEGWKDIKGKTYYFADYSYEMYAGSIYEFGDDEAYYFAKSGECKKGWITETETYEWGTSTTTYYADPNTGKLAKGWTTVDGKQYCFGDPDDSWGWGMLTGVQQIGGKWYYFTDNGVNKRGGWIKDVHDYDDWSYTYWYYAKADGTLVQGWKKIGGKWYYFRNEEYTWPSMICNAWEEIGGKKYLFDKDGVMQSGGWIKQSETYSDGSLWTSWYYADSDGVLKEGWFKKGGKWYYLEPEMVQASGRLIGKKVYVFDNDGVLASKTGWFKTWYKSGGKTYYDYYYLTSGGVAKVGWQKIGGAWYFFDKNYGYMYCNGGYVIDEKTYAFDANGKLMSKTGWVSLTSKFNNKTFWLYLKSGGICTTGWKQINKKWYYFDEWGDMQTGVTEIQKGDTSTVYFFDDNGVWQSKKAGWVSETRSRWSSSGEKSYKAWFYFVDGKGATGWKKISKKWYYFDMGTGEMYAAGTYYIDDKNYTFNKDGVWVK